MLTDDILKALLEGIIYIAPEPVTLDGIVKALEGEERERIKAKLAELLADYEQNSHGIQIRQVANGYKFSTKAEHHEVLRKYVKSLKAPVKLSKPALETLAVIAYRQPVTIPEIEEIRGVDSGGVIHTLMEKKLVVTSGRKNVVGRPILYRTSKDFLVHFGLKDVGELPSLKEFEELAKRALGSDWAGAEAQPGSEAATPSEGETATPSSPEPDAAAPDSAQEAAQQAPLPIAEPSAPAEDAAAPVAESASARTAALEDIAPSAEAVELAAAETAGETSSEEPQPGVVESGTALVAQDAPEPPETGSPVSAEAPSPSADEPASLTEDTPSVPHPAPTPTAPEETPSEPSEPSASPAAKEAAPESPEPDSGAPPETAVQGANEVTREDTRKAPPSADQQETSPAADEPRKD